MTCHPRTHHRSLCALLLLLLLLLLAAWSAPAQAQQQNRLRRIKVVPHKGYTKIDFFFETPPDYAVSTSGDRVRLLVRGTDAPLFRRFRSYSDPRVAGIFTSLRDGGVRVVIPVKGGGAAAQAVGGADATLLSLLVSTGRRAEAEQPDIVPGREAILSGAAELVNAVGASARAALPFNPTDPKLLKKLLTADEAALFLAGEEMLYVGKGAEAVQVFTQFGQKPQAVKALASFRLGEAYALQERNAEALAALKEGIALAPGHLAQAPEMMQLYAEVLAKTGDQVQGKALLVRLIGQLAGTSYVAPLMNRLAEICERHGDTEQALAMYRAVAQHAEGTEAAGRAFMKLADRDLFGIPQGRYPVLLKRYQAIYDAPGGQALRDEALFKMALLPALYGPAAQALESAATYDRRYPRGIFSTIVKKMHQQLLLPVYHELVQAKDDAGLVRLCLDHREALALCLAEPGFVARLSGAFEATGRRAEEIRFFSYLAERSWVGDNGPFLLARIVEDAFALGDVSLAESTARKFLQRFPQDARGYRLREQLAKLCFDRGDFGEATSLLGFLKGKKQQPEFAESGYYLGKGLAHAGDHKGAEAALAGFAQAAGESPFAADAWLAVAIEREALKDSRGALAAYQQAEKVTDGERKQQCLYKIGELYLQFGNPGKAAQSWEQAVREGGSGSWVKLATISLQDLKWRLNLSKELR